MTTYILNSLVARWLVHTTWHESKSEACEVYMQGIHPRQRVHIRHAYEAKRRDQMIPRS